MNCRFGLKHADTELDTLPPGLSEIACELEVIEPGPFQAQLHLFVDDHGTREIVFTVRGTARAPATQREGVKTASSR